MVVGVAAGLSLDLLRESASAGAAVSSAGKKPWKSHRLLECPPDDLEAVVILDYEAEPSGSSTPERAIDEALDLRQVPDVAPAKDFEKAEDKSEKRGPYVAERDGKTTSAIEVEEVGGSDDEEFLVSKFAACDSALEEEESAERESKQEESAEQESEEQEGEEQESKQEESAGEESEEQEGEEQEAKQEESAGEESE